MKRTTPQAIRAPRARHGQPMLRLRHLLLLVVLALATTTPTAVGATDNPTAGWTPEITSAATLVPQARPIADFPGRLRLPARDQQPVAGLAILDAAYALRPAGGVEVPFYQVLLGDSSDPSGPMLARYFGARGGQLFPTFGSGPARPEGCPETASYCTDSHFGPGGEPTSETFFDLRSGNGERAQVVHGVVRGSQSWSVIVHDPAADEVYGFTLHDAAAERIGASGLSPENRALAQRLVDQAAGFESISLNPAADPSPSLAGR